MKCVGGVLDGQDHASSPLAVRLKDPVASSEWVAAYAQWQAVYGVAWAASDHNPDLVPPPPDMPCETYRSDGRQWLLEETP